MFTRNKLVLCATVLILGCTAVHADTVTITSSKDNTLYEDPLGGVSNGAGYYTFAGSTGGSLLRRALIQFDIAGNIPAGSTINSVSLTLNMSRTIGAAPALVELRRVSADWGEGTSDAAGEEGSGAIAATGDATWLHTSYNTQFWTNIGGDFSATVSASQVIGGLGFYTWSSTSQMVADVQSWLNTPANNFGWILIGDEKSPGTSRRFDCKDVNIPANRPQLMIDFTPPEVPAVSPLGLLIMAALLPIVTGLILFRSKRKLCSVAIRAS